MFATASTGAQDRFQDGLEAYLAGDYAEAQRIWLPLAEAGDTVAAFNVGILHAQGLGVAKDPRAAIRWYKRAAEAGYAPAQFNLGAAYREGAGVAVDMSKAVHWWSQAEAQGHPQATFNLATLYFHGNGVTRDRNKAHSLYRKAAELGDPRAQQILAKLETIAAQGPDRKPASAVGKDTAPAPPPGTAARPPASAGPTPGDSASVPAPGGGIRASAWVGAQDADHLTIQLFAFGDEQSAVKFIKENGLEQRAAYFRATSGGRVWYKTVYGVYLDITSARAARDRLPAHLKANSPWIRRFSAIHKEMGGAGRSGRSAPAPRSRLATDRVPPNVLKARVRGQRAFNDQDYDRAFRAWTPLAENGDAEAQYSLGFMYESGWGMKKDYAKAYDWYRKAADQGHPRAQYNLGLLYFRGLGVDRDKGLAYYWIQNAADQHHERAREFLLDRN